MLGELYRWGRLLHVSLWIKNVIVFAPLFFSGSFFCVDLLSRSLWTFFALCLMSSSVYCFNDIVNAGNDTIHSARSYRPIADRAITSAEGYVLMFVCAILGILVIAVTGAELSLFVIISAYWLLNIVYSLWLKRIAVIDITCISISLVLQALVGGLAIGIVVSQWLLLMTYLLAMFLALIKRYDNFLIAGKTGEGLCESTNGYSCNFVSIAMTIVAAVMLVCYVMYTMSGEVAHRFGTPYVFITSLWVLIAVLRFLQVTIVFNGDVSHTRMIITDRFLWLCFVGWLFTFFLIIYS